METIKCAKCGCIMGAASEICPMCGTVVVKQEQAETLNRSVPKKGKKLAQFMQPTQQKAEKVSESVQDRKETTPKTEKKEQSPMFAEGEYGVKYKVFNEQLITVEVPEEVTYYNTVLAFFEDFIEAQRKNPKNDVRMGFTLDLDKIELADGEMIEENDIRLGVSAFEISNEVFSRYNDCKPLFEEKVNNGKPQIFIGLHNSYLDINECAVFAEEHKIPFAQEIGIDPVFKKYYESIILSFDNDAEAATRFFCHISDCMLSVPKDTPVTAYIDSYESKAKAQKEYKKFFSFGTMDYMKGAMLLVKDKITGK